MNYWGWVFFSFNGRISRKYYWYTFLLFLVAEAIFFGVFLGSNLEAMVSGDMTAMSPIAALCALPLSLVAIWVSLAVSVKRFHDRGKSGWWVLIGFIPLIGAIWLLVELGFLPGTATVNQYGVANQPPTDPFNRVVTPEAPLQSPHDVVPPRPSTVNPPPAPGAVPPSDAQPPQETRKDDNPYAP